MKLAAFCGKQSRDIAAHLKKCIRNSQCPNTHSKFPKLQNGLFLLLTVWFETIILHREAHLKQPEKFQSCTFMQYSSKQLLATQSPTSHFWHFTKILLQSPLAKRTHHLICLAHGICQCLLLLASSLLICVAGLGHL